MEDVLQVYARPYNLDYLVVYVDQASKQLIGEVATPQGTKPGQPVTLPQTMYQP